jgi:eukaryotic-like serine/threonine-protein kinase
MIAASEARETAGGANVDESRKEMTPGVPEQAAEEVEVLYETAQGKDAGQSLLTQLTPGTVISGKYRVDSILGRGAMGVVVAATHLELREAIALKFLYAKTDGSEDFKSRFRREAQVSAKLRNEHITRVLDVGTWREGAMYMVMEYLPGNDLRKMIRSQGPFPIGAAVEYIVQVCEGVAEAHAHGIVHRDLKPSNLLVTKRADGSDLVKILDFGISKWTGTGEEEGELTQTGVVLGSPKYMSPEQLFGAGSVDARTDIWSIGAILYELIAGRPPYDQPSLARICADLAGNKPPPPLRDQRTEATPELEAVVLHCLERTVELRIQSVADLAGDLLAAVGSPYAEQVRARIRSTLDPSGTSAVHSSLRQPGGATGNYTSLAFADASASYHKVSSQTGAPGVTATLLSSQKGGRNRHQGMIAVALLAIAGVGGWLFLNRQRAAPSDEGSTAAPTAAPPPMPTTAVPVPAVAAAAPAATVTASPEPATQASNPTGSKTPAEPVRHVAQPSRPAVPRPGPRTNTPPPTADNPTAPTATATATASPTPPSTTIEPPRRKPNPLEDRQ